MDENFPTGPLGHSVKPSRHEAPVLHQTESTFDAALTQGSDGAGRSLSQHTTFGPQNATGWKSVFAPPVEPDELGMLGQYRIVELIGKGGMGYVFRAIDTQLNRVVALKIVRQESERAAERFLREARALAAVSSEHVVTIYQVGQEGDVSFLVMEHLEGCPLGRLLERQEPFSHAEILRLGREAAEGLAATHERGLVHRDIKPDNLWVCAKNKKLKILDFGVAHDLAGEERLTQAGSVLGTPMYMAPEQAEGALIDARADLFALGCVLYLLCTGENAFRGKSAFEVLTRLAIDIPPSPKDRNPNIPEELSDLVDELLEKDPVNRPASAAVVASRLAEIEADHAATRPVKPRIHQGAIARSVAPPSELHSEAKPEPSHRWHPLYILLLAVGLVLLAWIAFRPPPPPHHRPPPPWEHHGNVAAGHPAGADSHGLPPRHPPPWRPHGGPERAPAP